MKRIIVAAGMIRGAIGSPREDLYLISQRPSGTHLAGAWEFPGGKVESGEDPADTLARELKEELGIEVEVGDIFAVGQHTYPERDVILLVYDARHVGGEPQRLEVADFRWMTAAEVAKLPLPPADRPVVERIVRDRL